MSLPVEEMDSPAPTAVTAGQAGHAELAELSIAFSVEELVALARVSGYRLAALGANPLAHVRLAERTTVLDIATRSLRARNVVRTPPAMADVGADAQTGTETNVTIAEPVLTLLAIVDGAALRADVTVTPNPTSSDGAAVWHRRYHAVPYAAMAHDHHDGVHRFTPFATEDLLARIAREAHLAQRPTIGAQTFTLPYAALFAARSAAAGPVHAEDGRVLHPSSVLTDAGVGPENAALFAAALTAPGRTVAVRITHRSGATALTGGELVWLDAGEAGLWLLPSIDQSFGRPSESALGSGSADGGAGLELAALADTSVDVGPTTAEHLAERLFSFLPAHG